MVFGRFLSFLFSVHGRVCEELFFVAMHLWCFLFLVSCVHANGSTSYQYSSLFSPSCHVHIGVKGVYTSSSTVLSLRTHDPLYRGSNPQHPLPTCPMKHTSEPAMTLKGTKRFHILHPDCDSLLLRHLFITPTLIYRTTPILWDPKPNLRTVGVGKWRYKTRGPKLWWRIVLSMEYR